MRCEIYGINAVDSLNVDYNGICDKVSIFSELPSAENKKGKIVAGLGCEGLGKGAPNIDNELK